jgi:hypothetical protein
MHAMKKENDIIREYFRTLQKKSAKTQFGTMTKEQRSEYFRKLQEKSAKTRRKRLSIGIP